MITLENLEQQMSELTDMHFILEEFLDEVRRLQKKDETVRIVDLDDTLFGRKDQLDREPWLRENRWEEGNKYILYRLGLEKFIAKYYEWISYPQEIVSQIQKDKDVIMTAGFEVIQKAKIESMGLSDYNHVITKNGIEKILTSIRYILYTLKFLPQEIIVYEDRPEHFIKYKSMIEWILWCKLTIMYVEMDGNKGYKKIEKVS